MCLQIHIFVVYCYNRDIIPISQKIQRYKILQTYTTGKAPGLRFKNGKLNIQRTAACVLFIIAAALFTPLLLFTTFFESSAYIHLVICFALPIAGIALSSALISTVRPMIPFCIISALLLFLGLDLSLAAFLIVFFLTVAISAYLLNEKLVLPVIIANICAYGIALFLIRNPISAISAFASLPAAFALFLAFKHNKQRVPSVLSLSAAIGIPPALALVAWICVTDGGFSIELLKNFFNSLRLGIIAESSETFVLAISGLQVEIASEISVEDALYLIETLVNAIFNYLPAITVIILFVISYITHSLYISLVQPVTKDKETVKNALVFNMSVTSAVIFICSFVAGLILDGEGLYMYGAATKNIYAMLFPGLALIAFAFFSAFLKQKSAGCLGAFIYLLMFGLIFMYPDVAVAIISFSGFAGAVIVIFNAIKNAVDKKRNGTGGSN